MDLRLQDFVRLQNVIFPLKNNSLAASRTVMSDVSDADVSTFARNPLRSVVIERSCPRRQFQQNPNGTQMTDTRPAIRKGIASKYFAFVGIALVIVGGLAFLNSLGSGGGYFAAALVISGIMLILGSIIKGIIKVTNRH